MWYYVGDLITPTKVKNLQEVQGVHEVQEIPETNRKHIQDLIIQLLRASLC